MEEENREFAQLMQRVRAGEPEAARELFDRYGKHILRVVRKRMPRRLRRRYDSTDFTQTVWTDFFNSSAERYSFPTPAALMAFLTRMADSKVKETTRQSLGTLRGDMAREQSLDSPHPSNGRTLGESMPGSEARPSQTFMAEECWQRMVEGQPPGHRRILEMLRDGYSQVDIIEKTGVHRKMIKRLLEHLQFHLESP